MVSKDRKELYPSMPKFERLAIDNAFIKLVTTLRESGVVCATDDRAENLVGAIARYVSESRSR